MFSPNMLKTYQSCPQKYWFKYVQKISVPQKSSYFEKGKKIHALAHYYLRGDNISKLETVLNLEEKKIWENLKENEYFQKSYVNSEYNLSCKIEEYWIGGRLDALVKDEENYYILDYKTGQIPKNPEFDFQTAIYLLCASEKFGKNIKFVYIDLKNNENCVIDFDKDYETEILEICKKLENIEPTAEKSRKCEFCEYSKLCIFNRD